MKTWGYNIKRAINPRAWTVAKSVIQQIGGVAAPTKTTYKRNVKKIIKIQEEKEIANRNVRRVTSSYISPGKSFAYLFNQNSNTNVVEFLKLTRYFMQPEELTIEQEIEDFLKEYRLISKSDAKSEFVRLYNKVSNAP